MKLFNLETEKQQKILIDQYYDFLDNETILIKLNFETFDELIDQNFGDDSVERLNNILFDEIEQSFEEIPLKYRVVINLHFENFNGYTKEIASKIIEDNLLLKQLTQKHINEKQNLAAIYLLIGGIILLLSSYGISFLKLPQIILDILNISGTLLIWEAGSKFFLENRERKLKAKRYAYKIKKITIE